MGLRQTHIHPTILADRQFQLMHRMIGLFSIVFNQKMKNRWKFNKIWRKKTGHLKRTATHTTEFFDIIVFKFIVAIQMTRFFLEFSIGGKGKKLKNF